MGGMGYTTTLATLAHTLHTHVDRCMKTRDVTYHIMKNDLKRVMQVIDLKSWKENRPNPSTQPQYIGN